MRPVAGPGPADAMTLGCRLTARRRSGDVVSTPPAPPAGWYPHGAGQRYWDGQRWTQHTAPNTVIGPTTGPAPGLPPSSPYASPQDQTLVASPGAGYAYPPVAVAAKSPGLSLLASFFIPGLGSMINGEVSKGVLILIGYVVSWFLTIILIGIPGLVAVWIWGMVDGYQGAQRWNARYGILS